MTTDKRKSVVLAGHRSEKLPRTEEELLVLRKRLGMEIARVLDEGYDTFLFGADYGFGLMAADAVISRKHKTRLAAEPPIRLIAAIPYEEQAKDWKESDRNLYYNTLALCDEVITLQTHYRQGCFHERDRWMIDRASLLIAYYDGMDISAGYIVTYASTHGLEIINLCDTDN